MISIQKISLAFSITVTITLIVPAPLAHAQPDINEANIQTAFAPIYTQIFNEVDRTQVLTHLKEMTGVLPVTLDHQTLLLSERYTPTAKAQYRKYWKNYFNSLGIDVQEFNYATTHSEHEAMGHDLEAILPGKSTDTIVIIVHYDSMGPDGRETSNPSVDDDMTGMATLLETARVLSLHKNQLHYTVRFVAVDFEEWGGLEGSREYAKYIKDLAARENFKLVAAIDDEQSGWNCVRDQKCKDHATAPKMLINDCSTGGRYASKNLSQSLQAVIKTFSKLPVVTECAGPDSDHYSMWEIGVPTLEFGEFSWETNDHYDERGDDTYEKIDEDYYFTISRLGVVFAATQVGIE